MFKEQLLKIRPRTIVYLFSGGKDSSMALLKTRDIVRDYAREYNARVYMVHITITGNTHPLNVYASASIMFWHKKLYGFEPIFLSSRHVFQEYMARYGLVIGVQRWCFQIFKNQVLYEYERTLPRPILEIDGISPRDSVKRSIAVKSEFEQVQRKNIVLYRWHPLMNYDGDPLDELRRYEEFQPIVKLYEIFSDSLNCVVCPYKSPKKLIKYHGLEDLSIISNFVSLVMRSEKWKKLFSFTKNKTLLEIDPVKGDG